MNRLARCALFSVGIFLVLLPATTVMTQERAGLGPAPDYLAPAVAQTHGHGSHERRASGMDAEVIVPATTPGTAYANFDGTAFRPDANDDGSTGYVSGGGIWPKAYGWYYAHLDLPQAAIITELSWYWKDNSAGNMDFYVYRFGADGMGGTPEWHGATSGASPDIQTTSVTGLDVVVDNTIGTYVLYMQADAADPGLILYGVRVGYVTASPAFFPITPARVYDSQCTGGPIARGRKRTISIATGVTSQGCAIGAADVVPAGARAVTYNLTVKSTVAKGWLGVVAHGATFGGTSSISWFGSSQFLANGGVVSLGGDRRLDVYAGGLSDARTHFIVDITGYYR